MKKYYSTLSKEQKLKINEIYQKEYKNSDLNTRLKRLVIYVFIGIVFSIFMFIDLFLLNNMNIGNLIIAITLLIASFTFLIGRYLVKLKTLNKIALKNK